MTGSERRIAPQALNKFKTRIRELHMPDAWAISGTDDRGTASISDWMAKATSASAKLRACSPTWMRGSAEGYECTSGDSGRTGITASKNFADEAYPSSRLRLLPVHRRDSGACQDIRRYKRRCATSTSIRSVSDAVFVPPDSSTHRTAVVRDPYARWCGRGDTARCSPIPIPGPRR